MRLARVIGNVVATAKNESLVGRKLLFIQPITPEGEPNGKPFIAVDAIGAGAGETVFWCRGREASFPFLPSEVPTDCTIVAIVDSVYVGPKPETDRST
jgi:microcompartment protein CcmK/EutM